ncbi:MAG: LEA type 2 family protein [Gemmatimonadota bacterium]|jgi:hypothetical protein
MTRRRRRWLRALAALLVGAASCATLESVVQAPVFGLAGDRDSRVRVLGPSVDRPLGGAEIQVWARVENPNPIGFTLSRLAGTVLLADHPAARVDLPLGLPLEPAADTVLPLTLTVSFADVPDLAGRLRDAVSTGTVEYALRGTVSVDAGAFGRPSFGPQTWLRGQVGLVR